MLLLIFLILFLFFSAPMENFLLSSYPQYIWKITLRVLLVAITKLCEASEKKNHSMWFGDGWKIFSNIFPSASFQHCCSPWYLVLWLIFFFINLFIHYLLFAIMFFQALWKITSTWKLLGILWKPYAVSWGQAALGKGKS